jgi:nonribosomal peptide synthetase CepK
MINAYGPTEATVAVTASDPLTGEGTPPIGRPITGVSTYVLDDWLAPVPDGDVGELYMAGPGLARGYLHRPAATAERFLPNPFGGPGERMYRTGDRVWAGTDGQLVFVGRADDQLKVRGHRIEPGEVESALLAVDGVAQAVVTEHDNRLVAYLVGAGGARVAAEDLLPQLRKRLPSYLVPDVVVGLPRLPTSPNGKVDRAALPAPDGEGAERVTSGRAPSTPTEIHLAALFAEVLGVSSVGVEDSFFDVGGHSLLATRLVARIRESLQVRLRVQVFFNAPTVAQLARVLDGAPT